MLERLEQIWYRLRGYIENEPWTVVIELATIWVLVFVIAAFLRGTRGGRALKGAALVFIVATLFIRIVVREDTFERLNFIYSGLVGFAALALVILFQPEIRRALVRLGETRWFGQGGYKFLDDKYLFLTFLGQWPLGEDPLEITKGFMDVAGSVFWPVGGGVALEAWVAYDAKVTNSSQGTTISVGVSHAN